LLERTPGLDPADVEDVILGNANGAGEHNRDVARMAVLLAGLPTSVPGVSVNRLCGSSLEATIQGSRAIEAGDASLIVAGGGESKSRAPWVLLKPATGLPAGHETLHSTTLGWRMVNPEMPDRWTISLGASAEKLADMYNISRDDQDAFALRSHQLTAEAWKAGVYDDEVVAVSGVDLDRDEGVRHDSSLEKLGKLKPAFVEGGTVTAGNSSPLNDGASMVLLGDEAAGATPGPRAAGPRGVARRARRRPRRLRDRPGRGGQPRTAQGRDRLGRPGRRRAQRGVRLAVAACLRQWPELDPEIVNVRGGAIAIAIGHPLGASGARIVGRLAHELRARGGEYGLAAICIGVGQGLAMVIHA
jgi:acetyl-CoA acetyltransferase